MNLKRKNHQKKYAYQGVGSYEKCWHLRTPCANYKFNLSALNTFSFSISYFDNVYPLFYRFCELFAICLWQIEHLSLYFCDILFSVSLFVEILSIMTVFSYFCLSFELFLKIFYKTTPSVFDLKFFKFCIRPFDVSTYIPKFPIWTDMWDADLKKNKEFYKKYTNWIDKNRGL